MYFTSVLAESIVESYRIIRTRWSLLFVTVVVLFVPRLLIDLHPVYVNYNLGFIEIPLRIDSMLLLFYDLFIIMVLLLLLDPRRQHDAFRTQLQKGAPMYLQMLLLYFLRLVALMVLVLFLVIPAVIFYALWIYTLYALLYEKTSVLGSFSYSQKLFLSHWQISIFYVVLVHVLAFVQILGLLVWSSPFGELPYFVRVPALFLSLLVQVFYLVYASRFFLMLIGRSSRRKRA